MKHAWLACCLCILCSDYLLDSCCAHDQTTAPSVNLSPRLLIVPVNTSVLLTCEVRFNGSYSVQWYRDSIHLVNDSTFSVVNNSNINLTLSVTDEYKPDTQIYCVMHDSATGSVITESDSITVNAVSEEAIGAGLAANPQVEPLLDAESSPGFRLRWSPPFLWRAFPIDYCVVSIIRTNHSDSVHYGKNIKMIAELNTTFSESGIMSLHFNECNDDQQSQSCVVMMFVIMAFNSKDGFHSKSVSAIGRYPSDVGNFSESAISTVTMVSSNAFSQNLLVRIQIKLPPLCSYQEMSYSILIYNANESAIYNMTFYRIGSGTVCHDVSQDDADGLMSNQNYTLKVIASASFADSEPARACHEFNTVSNSAYKTKCNDLLLILLFTVLCLFNNTYYK